MSLIALDIPPGLNSDDTTLAAEGRWADGNNVRFVNGKAEVIGSIALIYSAAFGSATCRAIRNWTTSAGNEYTAFGTNAGAVNGLVVENSATLYDITPTPSPGPANGLWGLDLWGDFLIAHAAGGTLYVWANNTASRATEITQAPDVICATLVTPQRQILAFGCNEEVSGAFNARCIRGCDIEDYTDWTTTAANNAFEHILEAEAGELVAARMVGDYIGVWTTTGLWLGTFVGDPGQAYRFEKVAHGCGMAGFHGSAAKHGEFNAVTVLNGVAYWLGADYNFYAWAPGAPPQVIPCPIGGEFRKNARRGIGGSNFCFPMAGFREVWWFYDDIRDAPSIPTRYVALCTADGSWFRGQLTRTAMIDASGLGANFPRATDGSGNVLYHEYAPGGTESISWHIQTADQAFMKGNRRVMVRGVQPDFENQSGDVSLTLGVRDRPQATATIKGPYTLTTATTKKDFRASGKFISVKFSGSGVSSYMRLGTPLFDIVPMGER